MQRKEMKERRLVARPLLFFRLIAALALSQALSACYVTSQAWHQNNLFNSRVKVSEVLADPKTPATTRKNLELTREILAFAKKSGLNSEGAYSYFIETGEPVVSYLVQAAHADSLTSVTWWFPIIGRVPYMGYFKRSDRDEKAAALRGEGYDVYESGVGAFSSLGWFDDPIFSPMLGRGEAELAHLLLHELTHRTLWVPGSSEFNENLAEYVADILTKRYLEGKNLQDMLKTFQEKRDDRETFKTWLRMLKAELETLYKNPPRDKAALLNAKAQIFARFTSEPLKPKFKVVDYVGSAKEWNNAAVMGASLYSPDTTKFSQAAKCVGGDVKDFLAALKKAADEADDGFTALDLLCRRGQHVD